MKIPVKALLLSLVLAAVTPNALSQSKIVGGSDASPGQYPWMAAIVNRGNPDVFSAQFCGGALIHESWVLTAAHCVEGEFTGGIGVWINIVDLDDTTGGEYRNVKAIFRHPGYREDRMGNLFNDVALLLLESPVSNVTPISVPSVASVADFTPVEAIGWGDTESTPAYPTILQRVDLVTDRLSTARNQFGRGIGIQHLAASATGKDTCQGDSGGPLFSDGGPNQTPLLLGVTSFGLGCADNTVGIYANVGYYFSWINAFLSLPADKDPEIAIVANGRTIPPGATRPTKAQRTNWGRRIRRGRSKARIFTIANRAEEAPLGIDRVAVRGRTFSLLSSPDYVFGESYGSIRVRFRAPSRRKNNRGSVLIASSDPNVPYYYFRILARSR